MLLPLVLAGISLTASAVSWWNGRKLEDVRQEIEALESEFAEIHARDAAARRAMVPPYLRRLALLVARELATRDEVATELTMCSAKARAIASARFGSTESGAFQRLVLEMDLALSRVHAERAYLGAVKAIVDTAVAGRPKEVPSPTVLQLPNDFPREGGLVHFEGAVPTALHGYKLRVEDWSAELEGRAMLYDVDHERRRASVSTSRAGLLAANLTDAGGAMLARVVRRDVDGVRLDYLGAELLLPSKGGSGHAWVCPEGEMEVYPETWTLDEVKGAGRERPLRVRLQPRVEGSRKQWSPILLAVSEDLLPELVRAHEQIAAPSLSEAPWRLHILASGALGFTLGPVTLATRPNPELRAFVLESVFMNGSPPDVSVRFHAALNAFIPGSEDDRTADRSLFCPFVEAVDAELGSQKQMLLQRRSALRLRKLSLIYQDQEDHLRVSASCGFLPGRTHHHGRIVVGMLTDPHPPPWLVTRLGSGAADGRLRALGRNTSWEIRRASWENEKLGICRIELAVPEGATHLEIEPLQIRRLELGGEGSQQQIMSKALEQAILGRFASARVHEALLGLAGEEVENCKLGRAAVNSLLASDAEVVAIWGPPGTGKTTTLVTWLLSLFPVGRAREWPTVLLTAPTHVAVTKLLRDLLDRASRLADESVRYGGEERIRGSGLEPVWHRTLLEGIETARNGSASLDESARRWAEVLRTREGREAAAKWMLGSRHIHAATCVGMARRDYALTRRTFDIAIIDEAGKAFGAELLVPSAVARRVVMVGDHNQLPPTVTTEVLDEAIGYRLDLSEVEELLRRNVFHDLFEQLPDRNKGMLTMQYRMHAHIGDVVSRLFYEGRLESHRRDGTWGLTSRRMVVIDFTDVPTYRSRVKKGSQSQENPAERQALYALLRRLDARNDGVAKHVLVVCPYEAQRAAVLQETVDVSFGFQLEVSTVDAVQGGEADVVILLMTRSHGRVQFLLDRHRLNVALSRAREAVIVLGHLRCLTEGGRGPLADFVNYGQQVGTLDLVHLGPRTDFRHDLATRVVP